MRYPDSDRLRLIESTLCEVNKRAISTLKHDTRVKNDKIISLDISWKYPGNEKIKILPPDVFDNLSELTMITLESNEIENIPEKLFSSCYKLETVDFTMNRLHTLNLNFLQNTPNVKRLMFSNNGVETIEFNNVPSMPSVTALRLRGHSLEEFP